MMMPQPLLLLLLLLCVLVDRSTTAPVNKPKHKGKALVAGALAGVFGQFEIDRFERYAA
jgi:hypothetical protein